MVAPILKLRRDLLSVGDAFLAGEEPSRRVAKDYPEVEWDDWYIDIMTAKLVDPKRRTGFKVMVLPNLYGDIVSDLCAQMVGGLGFGGL